MAQTLTPNVLAARLSKALGRPITAKAVRTKARALLGAYSKVTHPNYQSHGYSAVDERRITAAFRASGTRTASASTAKVAARKSTKAARKATPVVATPDA